MLASLESRISILDIEMANLRKSIEKCSSDINLQESNNLDVLSKIENINRSIGRINSFKNKLNKMVSKNQKISKKVTLNNNSIKKLLSKSKNSSLKIKQLSSALRKSQEENQKLRNLFNRKLRTIKRKDLELETRIKNQRKNILALSKKIKALS